LHLAESSGEPAAVLDPIEKPLHLLSELGVETVLTATTPVRTDYRFAFSLA
jgi:hypothetical protein